MIALKLPSQTVKIDKGELVSYNVNSVEYIHQKGAPGWRNADTEMFPVIGPTAEANFTVWTPKGDAIQDQHGLLRELIYTLVKADDTTAIFQKEYLANTKIANSKYPDKSTVSELYWPYNFKFQKKYELTKNGLEITFVITAEEGMPYMLGYHPAFKTESKFTELSAENNSTINVKEIQAVGNRAYLLENRTETTLKNTNSVTIQTKGFKHLMLWTAVDTMLCIEPITFYPYAVTQDKLSEGYSYMGKLPAEYKVFLKPTYL
ncbi:aldose 1-epimerase [Cellulophaga sp. 20_2_10]|uniref:aldose epimerase family protein n=1 Tax=Cellulophaga sp. 20_2_10 TaxID=2942476 RepID=UPI00201AB8A1|nr:aldose 1-epimerase [Cellulophaga sp. 20_2_10]MCL5245136.1 aldose 1-epimerase [Cellulophaga sp. 20_2_10]